jgi:hypothetical protein
MEKGSVLVVGEGVEYFLVPYDAAVCLLHRVSMRSLRLGLTHTDVNQLDPKCVANQVVGQHRCTLQPSVRPFGWIWVRDVQASDGDG